MDVRVCVQLSLERAIMKKRTRKPLTTPHDRGRKTKRAAVIAIVAVSVAIAIGALARWQIRRSEKEAQYVPRPQGEITFNKDIAPIVLQNCAGCHRPGQSAPFSLVDYQEVKKHAVDIANVTARRFMPPWLPEHGFNEFMGERRLSVEQIGLLDQWAAEGSIEGAAHDLPASPQWSGDWQLGKPDLVVTLPQAYTLAAEGRDVYRNFVIPVPLTSTRYVKGVEFRPGNLKIVHHAFIKVDRSAQSRRLDAQDVEPGFAGMNPPAEMPDGHFLGWQPGRQPNFVPQGLAWRLDPGNDLVLQTHLNPSGRAEVLQPAIGLYFTDQPPTNACFKLALTSFVIDIPAGAQDYVVEDNYVLPTDVELLAVLPHAHYLAREMQGWATRPDGTRQWLLFIKEWDFNWQGDYRYAHPIFLPRGTSLSMRFIYDNSAQNTRNPNHPPKAVTYGPQSSDEMAELWFQLLPRNLTERELLARDVRMKTTRLFIESDRYALRKNPNDARAHNDLATMLVVQGRPGEAEQHFRSAIRIQPDLAPAHYDFGVFLRQQNRLAEAQAEFETAIRLNSKDAQAHGNLGAIFLQQGKAAAARFHFEEALRLNPDDALARAGLDQAAGAKPR